MPDYFCHSVMAQVVCEKLPFAYRERLKNRDLYLLGAQGPDVFFLYHANPTESNVGRELHRRKPYPLFLDLQRGNLTYACGFATHYCFDSILHPAVYRYEKAEKSVLAHSKFESDLGLYCSRIYGVQRTILPRERLLACTLPVYDSLKKLVPNVTVTGVERCLKRHFAVTRFTYARKRTYYRCDYPFGTLDEALQQATKQSVKLICDILDGAVDEEDLTLPFLNRE